MAKHPTKPTKFKSKKELTRFYITSEIFDSSSIPDFVKELCHKERATYRRKAPEQAIDPADLKKAHEIVRTKEKVFRFTKEGEREESELPFVSFDATQWRHYFQPESIKDLEQFIDEVGFDISLTTYDPSNAEHEPMEKWITVEIGEPLPEEPIVIAKIVDGFMMEDGEFGCECPECKAEREAQEQEGEDDDEG